MTIHLSAAEQKAASLKIIRAVKTRFPKATDAKRLHGAWPAPKPPVNVLWHILNDPAPLFMTGNYDDILIKLPDILSPSTSSNEAAVILGPLSKYYHELTNAIVPDIKLPAHTSSPPSDSSHIAQDSPSNTEAENIISGVPAQEEITGALVEQIVAVKHSELSTPVEIQLPAPTAKEPQIHRTQYKQ